MPTGYTAGVGEGKVTNFNVFAWQCARAFGALVMMRDDDPGTPIPEAFEPDKHHAKSLEKSVARLAELKAMTPEKIAEVCGQANAKASQGCLDDVRKNDETRANYEAMLVHVRAWKVPTTEHQGMRDFMEKQLVESIEWDCKHYPEIYKQHTPADWYANELDSAEKDIQYHTQKHAEEVERTNGRNKWLAALRESLS